MAAFTVVTKVPLPAYIPPDAVVAALHAYRPLIEANPHLTSYERRAVGIEEIVDDPFFRDDGHRLQAFTCYQRITIIPGVGAWATKDVSVPCVFQSYDVGVRCRADAGSGVTVWSSYEVRRRGEINATNPADTPPPSPDDGDFELVEIASVSCGALVRPFVRRSLTTAHQDILQRIADGVGRSYDAQRLSAAGLYPSPSPVPGQVPGGVPPGSAGSDPTSQQHQQYQQQYQPNYI